MPLALDIGPSELLIILVIVVVLFGGSRLAGLGKGAGRALREFKEETQSPDEIPADDQQKAASPNLGAESAAEPPAPAPAPENKVAS
ncbi:twin-arginine translocase TatA/TatE family subunit [Microlunatus elymi]|uniref:Sec-independent protein translocase protein TatA n=1 Tax=Microlunatus elymi TaxID=2596828 RepID=A0A516Q638_9ACTN|nr:twin-arginine translocase TatA/TatE family subunit [Microlunatus elymi]